MTIPIYFFTVSVIQKFGHNMTFLGSKLGPHEVNRGLDIYVAIQEITHW